MTRDAARRYLLAYDIAEDNRRLRVATKVSSYGDRIQFSVFVIDGRPAKLVRLRAAIVRIIDPETDSVLICDLGPVNADIDRRFDVIGRHRSLTDRHVLVF
jgi:CRISPR-associated protein Cas2